MDFFFSGVFEGYKKNERASVAIHLRPNFYLYFLDMVAIALIPLALIFPIEQDESAAPSVQYGIVIAIAMFAYSFFGFVSGFYDKHGFRQHLKTPFATFGGLIFTFGILLLIGFIFHVTNNYSRIWGVGWFFSFSVYILISRIVLFWYLSNAPQASIFRRQAVILGAGENGQVVLDHLLRFDDGDINVIGFLDDRETRLPQIYRGVSILGGTNLIERLVKEHGVDLVIMALPWKAHERIDELLKQLCTWRVDVYLAPDRLGLEFADRPVFRVGGMNILSLQERPISEWNAVIKRIEDISLVIPALLLLTPLLGLIALLIKLDSKGDVLFIQERIGFNNKIFRIYKFRSMYSEMSDWRGIEQTQKK